MPTYMLLVCSILMAVVTGHMLVDAKAGAAVISAFASGVSLGMYLVGRILDQLLDSVGEHSCDTPATPVMPRPKEGK